ncbi:MAG: YfhO family protein [Chloroflexia bacterium]|nr:YfhO family protein [Chloroflexia bacterium]
MRRAVRADEVDRETTGSWRPDALALGVLAVLLAVTVGNRLYYDPWLARFDLYTFFVPWYAHLGERLASFDVPGWNPHVFGGTPFAGDPESGWMYLPAMLSFALFPVLTGFKVMVGIHLTVAALSTYAYARVLGMRPVAALTAAVVFAFGPVLQWTTYCCLIFGQYVIWIPLVLLGIELALRVRPWRARLAPWCLTGFAVSQMFAGWVGEGWIYIPLLVGAYAGYRALLAPIHPGRRWRGRLADAVTTTGAGLGSGVALGAAGIWPRLATNAESHLAGGDYGDLPGGGILNPPWELDYLLAQVMGSGYDDRRAAFGGVAIALVLLAPPLARKRFAVPFFVPLTTIALVLALDTTPLHQVFYLIPRYRELHVHDPWRTVSLAALGPAILSGAAVEALAGWRGRRRWLPVLAIAALPLLVAATIVSRAGRPIDWPPLLAAAAATILVGIVLVMPRRARRSPVGWLAAGVPVLLVAVAFIQPTGLELTGAWLGWPGDATWERYWQTDPVSHEALAEEVTETASADTAAGFLQRQATTAWTGPFRYAGYGGILYPGDRQREASYMARRFEPPVQAILVNGRPMMLDLATIQGYNPLQLARYAEFLTALNGAPQDYHLAYLAHTGVRSPLLDLLSVRYVLVDATIPPGRDDIVALTAGRREVFRTPLVVVYERVSPPSHAWIVHDVRAVSYGETLPLLTSGTIDPYQTGLVEGPLPEVAPPEPGVAESARVTRYEPDAIDIVTTAASPGLLVVSEVYERGWRAYVDGERVDVLPTHHALRGVPIPAGEHVVEMRYEPLALRAGLPISAVTATAMVVVWAAAGVNRLRGRGVSDARRGRGKRA